MGVYDDIVQGLNEASAISENRLEGRKRLISIEPARHFSPEEIKSVRNSLGMTQALFAELMGVSKKTVEAWEAGKNKPEGPARRMLTFFKNDPNLPQKMNILAL